MFGDNNLRRENNSSKAHDNFGIILLIFTIFMVILLYWRWVLPGAITWGDWLYLAKPVMADFIPSLWSGAAGLGTYDIISAPFFPLLTLQGILSRTFHLGYPIIERLLWFYPFVLFLILSPYLLARILGFHRIGTAVTILVFNLNTYMFFTGGQMTIGMANALGPLVLAAFIRVVQNPRPLRGLLLGLAVAFQMIYEVRISYVTLGLCSLYLVYSLAVLVPKGRGSLWRLSKVLLLAGMITCIFHSYWLIPLLTGFISKTDVPLLPVGHGSADWVHTLSYMTLSHSLGLHVPWWGRPNMVNPVNPQFLILPILAFSILLFRKRPRTVTFFALSAIVFSFLVKGSNPPFGEVYIWLFQHFPGFSMFRTPGKFYMPLVLSYAVMLGYLVNQLVKSEFINRFVTRLSQRLRFHLSFGWAGMLIIFIFLLFIIFPVHPISTLHYKGIWTPRAVPEESEHIKFFLHSQPGFFRVLWLPGFYRFGYSSSHHPAIQAVDLDKGLLANVSRNSSDFCSFFREDFFSFFLRLLSVKYVIVPFAPSQERCIYYWWEHCPKYYRRLIEKTPGLKPVSFKGYSQVYKVSGPFPHFYVVSDGVGITDDDIRSFPAISRTEMLKNTPLFLLGDQISEKILENMNGLIFRDSSWRDLAVELSAQSTVHTLTGTGSPHPNTLAGTGGHKQSIVKIEAPGVYEIYFEKGEGKREKVKGEEWKIEIDGNIVYSPQSPPALNLRRAGIVHSQKERRKYVKVGEEELEEGKHTIQVTSHQLPVTREKDKELKMILVNKKEREKAEKVIWKRINQSGVKLCYVFNKDGKFYLPREGDYIVKARILPCLVRKKIKGPEIKFGIEKDIKNWCFNSSNASYDCFIDEDGILTISVYFDGNRGEDEFVQMQNKNVKVDLKEYPHFDLTYRIENPEIQTIEVVAGIDFDRDGKANEYIRGIYQNPESIVWTDFSYNLYGKVKKNFPDEKYYDLVHLELYPHKLWKADCSHPGERGKYRFWIKGLQFYNYSPEEFFEVIEDGLDIDLASDEEIKNWLIESKDEGYSLKSTEKILAVSRALQFLELSRPIDKIDIRQFPMIELEYKARESGLQNIELILGLDFDGDNIINESIFLDYLSRSNDWGKFRIDAYKLTKKMYPGKKEYNLMQVKLRLKGLAKLEGKHPFYLKRLRFYSSTLVSPADFIFDRKVIKIDEEKYGLKAKFGNKTETRELWFEQIVHLKRGEHYLNKVADDSFEVRWVIVEPETRNQKPETRQKPEITFKKINPTKYEVKVEGAKEPFWLVFSESFHKQWRLYSMQTGKGRRETENEIIEEYPKLGVKEAKYRMKFTPGDIRYLFKKPLAAEHHLVNIYANGWYIESEELGLGEDFSLVLYFLPQSLFYIGLMISSVTLLGCMGYLGYTGLRKRKGLSRNL